MANRNPNLDSLFVDAERLASDFSLFPRSSNPAVPHNIEGLISEERIQQRLDELRDLAVDEYVLETVAPVEDPARPGVRSLVKLLGWEILREMETGPLYAAEMQVEFGGTVRHIGLLAQDRRRNNGAWLPKNHRQAVEVVRELATHLVPIVTLIDTPGAEASAEANRDNQAHSISHLIAEMAQLHVPTVGVILGNGYSGGAIHLATTNILLSTSDGVFNTIQPRGLASIARKYNFSWQECAQAVGVSPYELYEQGNLDGIIDYSPMQGARGIENFESAVLSSILAVEDLARHFVATNETIFEHYRRTVDRFQRPTDRLRSVEASTPLSTLPNPTQQPNVYGVAYRYLRYLGLRKRIRSTTVEAYGRLSTIEVPAGELRDRAEREHQLAFGRWLESPLKIKYDDTLKETWIAFQDQHDAIGRDRGSVATFFLGSRESNYLTARSNLVLELAFHLYNLWKSGSSHNFPLLVDHLENRVAAPAEESSDLDVLSLVSHPDLQDAFIEECRKLILFDSLYDQLIADLKSVAFEAMDSNRISQESVGALRDASLAAALPIALESGAWGSEEISEDDLYEQLHEWVRHLVRYRRSGVLLKSVADWKKAAFPTVSEPLFALITFFFERLLPSYYGAESGGRYDGRIRPRNIGVKDFWNRLDRAYKDLLIQEVLIEVKRRERIGPRRILETFFTEVDELDRTLMTANPVRFPGFRISIEQALDKGLTPCGTVTCFASFEEGGEPHRLGVMVSNPDFQAGSFGMASCVKFCRLLVRCAQRRLPVVCFLSAGGMLTKEGAGALFSLPIMNDRITRFVRDNDLPLLVFAFGDCIGGVQASIVTHPLVDTYYFSGTSMPFAGQIVVQSHLPTTSTLSNYLSEVPGSMQGLVRHPFATDLDERLEAIDPEIRLPRLRVGEVIEHVLAGKAPPSESVEKPQRLRSHKLYRKVEKTLIHARGCTAVKLVEVAQRHGIDVVLVQSDPDMESMAASKLRPSDALVCLGGSTPDESYLNAHSVIRIAETEGCDSLHPGIGFLSESSAFADLCAHHGLNFIGPGVPSMERLGNKSNAIQTARRLEIPVVPGSHGVVTNEEAAAEIAARIGYPVMLKAVHGGGGRGIQPVTSEENFGDVFLKMAAEAKSAFGSRDLYVEKLVQRFRHVEVQVLRDRHGNAKILGLRDCSVQRNNQKVVEESGSTLLSEKRRKAAYSYALGLTNAVDYQGAGTVEFMFDLDSDELYFMEMNARLQVEHPVTESVTGIDIVGEQFRIAAGESIADLAVAEDGYAIEVRINAERIARDPEGRPRILPDPGTITACEIPEMAGVDVISAAAVGSTISPFYDNLLAQVIAHGPRREDAIVTLLDFLGGVRIEGVGTNIPLLRRILADAEFREGTHDTGYLGRLLDRIDLDELIEEVDRGKGAKGGAIDRSTIQIDDSDELKVVARSQGLFYSAPAIGKPDFVEVGDVIESSRTLCLIEAMKLFEELSLDTFNHDAELYPSANDYEILSINAHNGQLVNEGDLLFVVRAIEAAPEAAVQ